MSASKYNKAKSDADVADKANGSESPSSSATPSPSDDASNPPQQQQQQQQRRRASNDEPTARASSLACDSPDSCAGGSDDPETINDKPRVDANDKNDDDHRNSGLKKEEDRPPRSNSAAAATRTIAAIFGAHGKLKRLLGTLVHFAMDISLETGDTVRGLVLGLLSNTVSAEEFHSALQEATNFPLRGFVLPYLKRSLPALQRDLTTAARADDDQQTCAQYLRTHESAVLEAVGLTQSSNGGGGARGGGNGDAVVEPFGASGSTSPSVSGRQPQQHQQPIYSGRPAAATAAGVVLTSSSHAVLATSQHLAGAYGEAAAAAAGSHANKRKASDVL
uniref:TAFH domain-containing protein n=1 Tax=Trichogramma kaykai TaxID=54128 RepID=A0ABD2X5K4_9HYME